MYQTNSDILKVLFEACGHKVKFIDVVNEENPIMTPIEEKFQKVKEKPVPLKTDYNDRQAKGQAYNLAVHSVLATGKPVTFYAILKKYVEFYEWGQLLQSLNQEDIIKELVAYEKGVK